MKINKFKNRISQLLAVAFVLVGNTAFAQDGAQALDAAASTLTTYVDPITNVVMIIGGIIAIVGGVFVVRKWNNNEPDTGKYVTGWLASLVFLIIMPLLVRTFVGI